MSGNFERQLQADLHLFKSEGGRKFPKLRDCAERADRYLRELSEGGATTDQEFATALRQVGEILNPGLIAIETKNAKFMSMGWGYITRLAMYDAIEREAFTAVGQAMKQACDSHGDENVQLRVLQCITASMQAPTLLSSRQAVCTLVESILSLYHNKSATISNTAAATLRQSVCTLFEFACHASDPASFAVHHQEKAKEQQDEQDGEKVELDGNQDLQAEPDKSRTRGELHRAAVLLAAESIANACTILQELGVLAGGDPSKVLNIKTHANIDLLCLEVIDAVLRAQMPFCLTHSSVLGVLRTSTCPMIVKKLQKCMGAGNRKEQKFNYCIRTFRIAGAIVSSHHQALLLDISNIIFVMTHIITTDLPAWQQHLALETLRTFSLQPQFPPAMSGLFQVPCSNLAEEGPGGDQGSNMLLEMIKALERIVRKVLGSLSQGEAANSTGGQPARVQLEGIEPMTGKLKLYDMLGQVGPELPPGVGSELALFELALLVLCDVAKTIGSMTGVVRHVDFPHSLAGHPRCNSEVMMQNVQETRRMVELTWQHLLPGLQLGMISVQSTAFLEPLIDAYVSYTQACAVLQMVGPRDKALAPLCRSALPGGAPDGSAVPLHPHNILITKALMLLVFDMGGVLGDSWSMVLEVLQRLDSALIERGLLPDNPGRGEDPPKVLAEGSWSEGRMEAELVKLRLYLDMMFEQTDQLDDEAIVVLLGCLCRVSISSISGSRPDIVGANAAGKGEKMFGIDKVIVVMLNNLQRMGRLWEAAAAELSRVALHNRATVRRYGMTCITELMIAAFKNRAGRQPGSPSTPSTPQSPAPGHHDDPANFDMERRILAVYEELYRSPWADTKNYVLEGLYQLLLSCGEDVGPAWPLVLALLKGVAQDQEEQQVRQAFMCVQLVRNDFLSALPVDCLQLLLTTIGAYGCQGSDLNISLTAITLLWNIADFFGRERPALLAAFSEVDFHPQVPRLSVSDDGELVSEADDLEEEARLVQVHNVDQLWLVLYHQLRKLSVDERIEVRHSALRTLFTALETHGMVLERASWIQVVHELLLPVLNDVRDTSQSASQSGSSDAPVERMLGPTGVMSPGTESGKGGQQIMLIHHSRNTLSKQWHATWETAFQGVARMFQIYFHVLRSLSSADAAWLSFMSHLESAILSGSQKVASASLISMRELLLAQVKQLPPSMWSLCWDTLERSVERATADMVEGEGEGGGEEPRQATQIKIVREVIGMLTCLQDSDSVRETGLLKQNNLCSLIRMQDQLLCAMFASERSTSELDAETCKTMRTVACNFSLHGKETEQALWLYTFSTLLDHLPSSSTNYSWEESTRPPATSSSSSPSSDALVRASLNRIVDLFVEACPPPVQAQVIAELAPRLLLSMCSKFSSSSSPAAWKGAAQAFMSVCSHGLSSLNLSESIAKEEKIALWLRTCAGIKSFLLPSERELQAPAMESLEQAQENEVLDIHLAQFIVEEMLVIAPAAEVEEQLLSILSEIVSTLLSIPMSPMGPSTRSFRFYLAEHCLGFLFDLSSSSSTEEISRQWEEGEGVEEVRIPEERRLSIAKLAAPMLVSACRHILEEYVKDESEASSCPLPRARTEQVVGAARRLQGLELDPEVSQHLYHQMYIRNQLTGSDNTTDSITEVQVGRSRRRAHLLLLFEPMCKCISSNNPMLRDSLRSMLEMVGREVGIGECAAMLVGGAGAGAGHAQ